MIKTIYFRVDGDDGKFAGLGHVNRSLNFYTNLNKKLDKNHRFVFLSKYEEGIKILKEKTNKKVITGAKRLVNKMKPMTSSPQKMEGQIDDLKKLLGV